MNGNFFIQPDPDIEKERKCVQEILDKANARKKLLKNLEREKHQKRIQRIGEIADEIGIINLGDDVLKGAFLEIAAKLNNMEQLANWKKNSDNHVGSDPDV